MIPGVSRVQSISRASSAVSAVVLALSLWPSIALAGANETLSGTHVKISWLAPISFGSAETHVGIIYQTDPGWHVYWRNPGDSGTAPKIHFTSEGLEMGQTQWPAPKRIAYGPLINFGYEGETALLFAVRPKGASADNIQLDAKLEWLVCREECIPGRGGLKLIRPRNGGTDAVWAKNQRDTLDRSLALLPQPAKSQTLWQLSYAGSDESNLKMRLQLGAKVDGQFDLHGLPEFFPEDVSYLVPAEPQATIKDGAIELAFKRTSEHDLPATLSFLAVDRQNGKSVEWSGLETKSTDSAPVVGQASVVELLILLLSAVVGGLILNLMPCVLPVLSIKIMSLAKSHAAPKARAREGVLYSLGVVVTFSALGAALLAIRQAGVALGWGFHLQSPMVIVALILLFWMMALNFLGMFEMGGSFILWAGDHGDSSSFATGILSVAVAAPCTGPFMGSALGAAAVLPAIQAMGLFVGLGVGLAAPILLLSLRPSLMQWLPKPGAWMETLKQFFAFPLFATVLWLVWVLNQQTSGQGWMIASCLLLLTAFAVWLGRSTRAMWRAFAWVIAISAIALALPAVHSLAGSSSETTSHGSWEKFSPAAVEAATSRHLSVFVDFTAAWCITCQVNRRAVLATDAALKIFHDHNTVLLEADWTNQDEQITRALAAFGRNSIPVYAFYPADGSSVQILPQILSLSILQGLYR